MNRDLSKFYEKTNLDKIRVSLSFHTMDKKPETKAQSFSVEAKSFYGPLSELSCFPLAPDIINTDKKKHDRNKSSPSLYDFPNKKVTRKGKGRAINSGVRHGIKKTKSKATSLKAETSEIEQDAATEKPLEISQKENIGQVEKLEDGIQDYNPNKKFFKHKRPAVLQISLGKKQKQKKNFKQKESVVNYSNVFESLNSKTQFCKQLNIGRHVRSCTENAFSCNSVVKKDLIALDKQDYSKLLSEPTYSTDCYSRNLGKFDKVQTENKNEFEGEAINEEQSYPDIALDIENNNFSNNEMMTDVSIQNYQEFGNHQAVGNDLFFMESLASDNSFEQGSSSNCEKLKYNNGHDQYQYQGNVGYSDNKTTECHECNYVYELGNSNAEIAHFHYHSDYLVLQFQGWKEDSATVNINSESRIVIIKPSDPKSHTKKAFDVLRVINKDIGLCDHDLIDNHAKCFFMYVKGKSIIGILVAEYMQSAFRLETDVSAPNRMFSETFPVKCGINTIWVSKYYRRQGIATKMMDCLRNHFFSNYRMHMNDIAFSIPTISGRHFAGKYVRSDDFKVF